MLKILLIIHAFIALGLIGVILIQRSDGGALGGLGGGSFGGILTGRSSANLLTRITAILATIFMLNSLLLTALFGYERKDSLIDEINKNDADKITIPENKENDSSSGVPNSE